MTPGPGIFRTCLPKGFFAAGINCGVRRYRPDLGLIVSDQPCVATGLFTQNVCKAAPVLYCENLLPASNIKAIITNSGEANAATGEKGVVDNTTMAECVAKHLSCHTDEVLTASTGVIGAALSVDKITQAIPDLCNKLNLSPVAERFALSILTTDLVPKTVYKKCQLSGGEIILTGIAKGSGMIHPNMATMLGYFLTDAKLTITQSDAVLRSVTNKSFNMISVDGETSTNDSVFLLANGASGVSLACDADFAIFNQAMQDIAILLAKSIARDGEGASKLIEVQVTGLADEQLAKNIARSLTTSPLLKTAICGESPNWGRIIARIGAENINSTLLDRCCISIAGCPVFPAGKNGACHDELKERMCSDEIVIKIDFASGDEQATAWGCDLTQKYVTINAEYVT